jgi:hypothetical protein
MKKRPVGRRSGGSLETNDVCSCSNDRLGAMVVARRVRIARVDTEAGRDGAERRQAGQNQDQRHDEVHVHYLRFKKRMRRDLTGVRV